MKPHERNLIWVSATIRFPGRQTTKVLNLNITGVLNLFMGHAKAPQVYVNSKLFSS